MNNEIDIEKFVHDLTVAGIHYRRMGELNSSSLILKAVEIIKHQHTELQRLMEEELDEH